MLVGVRLQSEQIKAIDVWAAKQVLPVTRPEAIRGTIDAMLQKGEGEMSGRRPMAQESDSADDQRVDSTDQPLSETRRPANNRNASGGPAGSLDTMTISGRKVGLSAQIAAQMAGPDIAPHLFPLSVLLNVSS